MKRTDTQTLISAMRILARDVQCDDGVANSAIAEAADRLEELHSVLQIIKNDLTAVANRTITCTTFKFSVSEALRRVPQ